MAGQIRRIAIPDFVQSIIADYETKPTAFPEWEVGGALSDAGRQHKDMAQEQRNGWWAESTAFRFNPCGRDQSPWGIHFGPVTTLTARDGTPEHFPDIKEIDAGVLTHWRSRALEAKNPILAARYFDLLWEFTKAVTGQKPDIAFARSAIDNYLRSAELPSGELMIDQIRRLERALELSISINDAERMVAARDRMIWYFEERVLPSECGAWHFLWDNLYESKKAPPNSDQLTRLIQAHETLLARYSNPENKAMLNPHAAKEVALRLAQHYDRVGRPDDVKRVIRIYGNAFTTLAREASGLLAIAWLQDVYEDYVRFEMDEDIEQLLLMLKQKGTAAEGEMKQISGKITISRKELDDFVTEITDGGLDAACAKIADYFLPITKDIEEELRRIHEEHPLMARIGVKRIGEQQITAEIGSIEDDPEGRTILQMSENIGFSVPFLAAVIDRLSERYRPTAEDLLTVLYQSPVFDEDRRALFHAGLTAFLERDYVKSIHVLVPQVEHVLRRTLGMLGRPTSKHVRSNIGVMQEKSLDDILEDAAMHQTLGDDVWRYLRAFLVDRRGHNLRNRLAHGLIAPRAFNRSIADRLIHVCLVLSMMRAQDASQDERLT